MKCSRTNELPVKPYQVGEPVQVTRYSGQKLFPTLVGFLNEKKQIHLRMVILRFGIAGERLAYLYPSKRGEEAGRFKSSKMRDWRIDIGTLERLRETLSNESAHRNLGT